MRSRGEMSLELPRLDVAGARYRAIPYHSARSHLHLRSTWATDYCSKSHLPQPQPNTNTTAIPDRYPRPKAPWPQLKPHTEPRSKPTPKPQSFLTGNSPPPKLTVPPRRPPNSADGILPRVGSYEARVQHVRHCAYDPFLLLHRHRHRRRLCDVSLRPCYDVLAVRF